MWQLTPKYLRQISYRGRSYQREQMENRLIKLHKDASRPIHKGPENIQQQKTLKNIDVHYLMYAVTLMQPILSN